MPTLFTFVIFSEGTTRIIVQHSVTTLAGLTEATSWKVGQDFGSFYFHDTNNKSEAVLFLLGLMLLSPA